MLSLQNRNFYWLSKMYRSVINYQSLNELGKIITGSINRDWMARACLQQSDGI